MNRSSEKRFAGPVFIVAGRCAAAKGGILDRGTSSVEPRVPAGGRACGTGGRAQEVRGFRLRRVGPARFLSLCLCGFVAFVGSVRAGEVAAREKLADQIIAFLKVERPEDATFMALLNALPGLVGPRHFPDLKALFESPISSQLDMFRHGYGYSFKPPLIRAIGATKATEAVPFLVDLIKLGEGVQYLREAAQALHALGADAQATTALEKLLPLVQNEYTKRQILDALTLLGDDSDETIKAIRSLPDRWSRMELLNRLRSAKAVPALIELFDDRNMQPQSIDASLRKLTLEDSLSGKAAWAEWWEKNKASFCVLGTSEQDVPKLVELMFAAGRQRDGYLRQEVTERLKKWPKAAIVALLPLIGSKEPELPATVADLLLREFGDDGRAAFAEYILSGKPLAESAARFAGPALANRVQTLDQVKALLGRADLGEEVKASLLDAIAAERQTPEYIEFYSAKIPQLSPDQRWRLFASLYRGRSLAGIQMLFNLASGQDAEMSRTVVQSAPPGWARTADAQKFCADTLSKPNLTDGQVIFLLRGLYRQAVSPEVQAIAIKFVGAEKTEIREAAIGVFEEGVPAALLGPIKEAALKETDAGIKGRLVDAVARARTKEALDVLAAFLTSGDEGLQNGAANALRNFEGTEWNALAVRLAIENVGNLPGPAQAVMMEWLLRTSPKEAAAKVLQLIAAKPDALSPGIVWAFGSVDDKDSLAKLKDWVKEPDAEIRLAAAAALVKRGDTAGADELRKALRAEEDIRFRLEALRFLENHPDRKFVPYLIERLTAEKVEELRKKVLRVLTVTAGQSVGQGAEEWKKWYEAQEKETRVP